MTQLRSSINDLFDEDDEIDFQPAPSLTHFHNGFVWPNSREIHLAEEILDQTGSWFVRCMRWLEVRDTMQGWPIRVYLDTPGGDVESMFAIHDAIRTSPCPVQVIGIGQVCSAGVLLLACGDERLVTENTALMSHESHGSEEGLGFRASQDRMKFRKWQYNRWCELMARYTERPDPLKGEDGMDAAWWKRKTERQAEYWLLGGHEIVQAGLADRVIHEWPVGPPAQIGGLATKRDYEGVRG